LARAALTRSERAPYLDGLDRAADAAAAAAGGYQERCYEISGRLVCLRFAGRPAIMRLDSALSHLRATRAAQPSLTIRIWESRPAPEGPWRDLDEPAAQAIRGLLPGGKGFFQWHDATLAVLDTARDEGYYWLEDSSREPWPERVAPLSEIFGGWLDQWGVLLVHAGAVGTEDGCVMLVGPAGSGKSHTALACLQRGLGHLGDDTCLLGPQDPPTAYSIYSSAQAMPFTLRCLPELRPMVSNLDRQDEEKACLFLDKQAPDALLREAPLRAIAVMSSSDHEHTHARPASPGDVLIALAPSSLLQQPGAGRQMLARLARIARGVKCVHLEAGSDPSELAQAVRELI
jgi:hypothetical protein